MANILQTIWIYTKGHWKHQNKHDMTKNKEHKQPRIKDLTEKQIDRIMRMQTKL